jgi:hypothetical protein
MRHGRSLTAPMLLCISRPFRELVREGQGDIRSWFRLFLVEKNRVEVAHLMYRWARLSTIVRWRSISKVPQCPRSKVQRLRSTRELSL